MTGSVTHALASVSCCCFLWWEYSETIHSNLRARRDRWCCRRETFPGKEKNKTKQKTRLNRGYINKTSFCFFPTTHSTPFKWCFNMRARVYVCHSREYDCVSMCECLCARVCLRIAEKRTDSSSLLRSSFLLPSKSSTLCKQTTT